MSARTVLPRVWESIGYGVFELHECTKCGTLYDPRTADYDTGDDPVCDSCVIARYPDLDADQDYMVFEHGIALF